jgi:hypothetical protein
MSAFSIWTFSQASRIPDHPAGREVIRAGRAIIRATFSAG